ncbi:MAG: valine--tRNA ligase [Lachnospiraceae bacterium]|jgi:valyl-tRNA synthetase
MGKQLDKTYDPAAIEGRLYQKWLDKKYFHAKVDKSKKPFSIVMPPPNITGKLHMGHALDNTMQDILIRFKRMQGYEALWVPGTDHASISTEVKVTNALKEKGIDKHEIGREEFLKHVWAWKKEYGGMITSQLKRIGSSCDWDRERFTMDEGCSRAVRTVFVNLYNKGLIYQGNRIINWCPVCHTSLSDAEVEYEDQEGHFWYINYPVVGEEGRFVMIATTRPETLLGDTALAVNPDDERYRDIVGKMVHLPLTDRDIPIIADSYVDKEFGTGVVKITPAHDPNDFEVGKRHNLEQINILNDDATLNDKCGKYAGMDRYEARKVMVEDLKKQGLLVKVETIHHNVGVHDRCHTTVEPMVKKQWFVKMSDLIKPAAEGVRNGEIRLIPDSMKSTYFNWTDNIRDWCISRQLWWGHRIPAYTCDDCGRLTVSADPVTKCPYCGSTHITQDPDTLDTWFSSALWPFSTLGWPDKTPELEYFYPTSVLVTGYDIIFFWVIRMIFSGYENMGKPPFKNVLFHGLVRDSQGRKMSKSLGNGIDPLEVIDKYGADALRASLISNSTPGNDMRFYYSRVEACRNFANKVWNASRFVMMNDPDMTVSPYGPKPEKFTDADKWILSRTNRIVKEVTDNLENYDLGIAYDKLAVYIRDVFCDWYIEMIKPRLYKTDDADDHYTALWTVKNVLITLLKLLHPFMPFITEEIFCTLQDKEESIMISKWPEYDESFNFPKEEEDIERIIEAVRGIRNARTSMNVAPSRKAKVFVVSSDPNVRSVFEKSGQFFASLAFASEIVVQADKTGIDDNAVSVVIRDGEIDMPFADLVDIRLEIERLKKEEARLTGEVKRSEKMLSNEKFLAKAPAAKVEEERTKQKNYQDMLAATKERLAALQK